MTSSRLTYEATIQSELRSTRSTFEPRTRQFNHRERRDRRGDITAVASGCVVNAIGFVPPKRAGCSVLFVLLNLTRPATVLAPSNNLLQEHAEIAEKNIARKISARFASSCKILDWGFGCG